MIEVIESLQKISEKNIFYISNPGEISLSRQGNSESEIFPGMRLIFIIKSLSNKIQPGRPNITIQNIFLMKILIKKIKEYMKAYLFIR